MTTLAPLGIPFMQKALGQGQLTDKELQEILRSPNSPFGRGGSAAGGMMGVGGSSPQMLSGLGMGQLAQVPQQQMLQSKTFGPSGGGQNMGLFGGGQATQGANGDWTPGPQGFPSSGGGGDPMQALAMFAGK